MESGTILSSHSLGVLSVEEVEAVRSEGATSLGYIPESGVHLLPLFLVLGFSWPNWKVVCVLTSSCSSGVLSTLLVDTGKWFPLLLSRRYS